MPCYRPKRAYRPITPDANGKFPLKFSQNFEDINTHEPCKVPCNQCIGCRIRRVQDWGLRMTHEASLYKDNCFITLTYDNDHLPKDGCITRRHFQLFMKKLRKAYGSGIRVVYCGEYGDQFGRPHYHACVFNWSPSDRRPLYVRDGITHYHSDALTSIWGKGRTELGDVNYTTATYIARYIFKKVLGKGADSHYLNLSDVDEETGEILGRFTPEFFQPSLKPGIGKEWFDQFKGDLYSDDCVIVRNTKGPRRYPIPKFYDGQFELLYPDEMKLIKDKRKLEAERRKEDNTPRRLRDKETIVKKLFKEKDRRNFDNEA